MRIARTDKEINDLLDAVARNTHDGGLPRFSGQTYEEGIEAAILWLCGDTEDHPYLEE